MTIQAKAKQLNDDWYVLVWTKWPEELRGKGHIYSHGGYLLRSTDKPEWARPPKILYGIGSVKYLDDTPVCIHKNHIEAVRNLIRAYNASVEKPSAFDGWEVWE